MRTRLLLVLTILCTFSALLSGQKKEINIGVGWGYLQGTHLNARYNYTDNLSLGIGVGSHFGLSPLKDDEHFSFTIENRFQFGQAYEGGTKPWVFGQQIIYWSQNPGYETWRIISIAPSFGLNLAFSRHIAMFVDIGPSVNLVLDVERPPMAEPGGWMWPILFNLRGQVVYRF